MAATQMSLFSKTDIKKMYTYTIGYCAVSERAEILTHAATCTDTLSEMSIHRQTDVEPFHWYEALSVIKFTDTESRMVVVRHWPWRWWQEQLWLTVFFWKDEGCSRGRCWGWLSSNGLKSLTCTFEDTCVVYTQVHMLTQTFTEICNMLMCVNGLRNTLFSSWLTLVRLKKTLSKKLPNMTPALCEMWIFIWNKNLFIAFQEWNWMCLAHWFSFCLVYFYKNSFGLSVENTKQVWETLVLKFKVL